MPSRLVKLTTMGGNARLPEYNTGCAYQVKPSNGRHLLRLPVPENHERRKS
ncbi:hypothetical protein [Endozoicomonas sp. ISHI1]|uniref:hypothetical protein n=1 Tax=Endozoicomonas sp. ISHI1 TaxID=2825882 RepID=UPI002149219C|nr:hypothetical protein [Endozoicomonas sp. ISHI1]